MPGLQLNIPYVSSPLGILKIVQIILGIIFCSLAGDGWAGSRQGWCLFVGSINIIISFAFFVIHLLRVDDAVPAIPWKLFEIIYTAIAAVLYFIAWCVEASIAHYYGVWVAATIFGVILMVIYGLDAFLQFRLGGLQLPGRSEPPPPQSFEPPPPPHSYPSQENP